MVLFEFFQQVDSRYVTSSCKFGRSAYYVLEDFRPDLAKIVRSNADIDPFDIALPKDKIANDPRWPRFVQFVEEHWNA